MTDIAAANAPFYTFKPVGQLGWYTKLLLRLACGGALIYAAAGFYQYSFLSKVEAEGFIADPDIDVAAEQNDLFYVFGAVLYGGLLLVSGILFLFWVYRAAANVHSVNPNAMTITPRWAVGWNFIPIAWYWKPYEAVSEIWHGSHQPGTDEPSTPLTLGWWWGCWVASQIIGHIGDRILNHGIENSDISQMKIGTVIGIADGFLFVAAAFLLAKIVDELSRTQDTLQSNTAVIFE